MSLRLDLRDSGFNKGSSVLIGYFAVLRPTLAISIAAGAGVTFFFTVCNESIFFLAIGGGGGGAIELCITILIESRRSVNGGAFSVSGDDGGVETEGFLLINGVPGK